MVLLVLAALAAGVAIGGVPDVGVWSVVGVLLLGMMVGTAAAPGSVLPLLFLIGLVAYRLMGAGAVPDAGLFALVALMPAVHQLAGMSFGNPAAGEAGLAGAASRGGALVHCGDPGGGLAPRIGTAAVRRAPRTAPG